MSHYVDQLIVAEMPRTLETINRNLLNIMATATTKNALGNSRVFIEYQTAIIDGVGAYGRTLRERLAQFDAKHSPVSSKDFDNLGTANPFPLLHTGERNGLAIPLFFRTLRLAGDGLDLSERC